MSANLLKETIMVLKQYGKTKCDVISVGNEKHRISWESFEQNASFEYDDGYGSQEIISDLKVYGRDFIMHREEYDGAEGWVFLKMPISVEPNCTQKDVSFRRDDNIQFAIPYNFNDGNYGVNSNEFSVQFECPLLGEDYDC